MDVLTNAWTWMQLNGDSLWGIWTSLVAVAAVIVAWTPTTKDDGFLSTIGSAAQSLRNVMVGRRLEDTRDQDPDAAVVRKAKG